MAVVGRVLFSFVIDRMNQRLASSLSFVSQAVALLVVINVHHDYALIAACALFGFSVGNLITLPALIVQREFDPRSFGVLVSLITAINQITYAFGPGVVGLLRDLSGSYTLPFYGCIAVELTAAVLIMIRGRGSKDRHPEERRDQARVSKDGPRACIGSETALRASSTMRSYVFPLPQQILQIQPLREHRERSVRRARPFLLRPVAIELDAVLVGIAQIKRLADAVVAGAVELDAGLDHAIQRIRQRRARGIENGGVKQPGGAWRRRMAAFAFPGVEPDVVVIAAGRNERRTGAHPLHHLEAEHAAIEPQRAFEIGDLEMDMPDPGAGDDGWVLGHVVSACDSQPRPACGESASATLREAESPGEGVQVYRRGHNSRREPLTPTLCTASERRGEGEESITQDPTPLHPAARTQTCSASSTPSCNSRTARSLRQSRVR